MEELIFATKKEAKNLVNSLKKCLSVYGKLTVGDVNWYSNKPITYADDRIGWYSINGIKIEKLGNKKYSVILPQPRLMYTKVIPFDISFMYPHNYNYLNNKALKLAINSVYGITDASFSNPLRDPKNIDNIVAK